MRDRGHLQKQCASDKRGRERERPQSKNRAMQGFHPCLRSGNLGLAACRRTFTDRLVPLKPEMGGVSAGTCQCVRYRVETIDSTNCLMLTEGPCFLHPTLASQSSNATWQTAAANTLSCIDCNLVIVVC